MITGCQEAYRQYNAFELTATKKMSDNWMLSASWVISKIEGNYNNTGNTGAPPRSMTRTSTRGYQPYMNGRLTRDNTHLAKLSGIYRAPYGINLAATSTISPATRSRGPTGRRGRRSGRGSHGVTCSSSPAAR